MKKFSKYFQEWLYGEDAYYTKYTEIGKKGDFFTSVSTSYFFGGAIAKKIIKTIEDGLLPKNTTIIEIGAHHAYLLADIIQFIYTLKPKLLKSLNFAIIEKYDDLRKKQKEYLFKSFGESIYFRHYSSIEELKEENSFVIANELFDSFACDLVYTNKKNILQIAQIKENHKIEFSTCEDKEIINHCKKYKIQKGEVCLSYKQFALKLCQHIKNFYFICFDYGDRYPRNDFSIRIYSKHRTIPFFEKDISLEKLYKKSDLTYDVHFNYLMDCFKEQKNTKIKFSTQLKALVDFGIIELLEILKANVTQEIYLQEVQKVKLLLEPRGMGDRFKVLEIKKVG